LLHQLVKNGQPLGLLHVEREALLVAMQVLVVGPVVVAPADHVVTPGGPGRDFQFDDTGTQIGERADGRRSGTHPGGIQNGEARQRAHPRSGRRRGSGGDRHPLLSQRGVNMGTWWPPSLGLNTTRTACPMATSAGLQSTRLVISVTPSLRVTNARV